MTSRSHSISRHGICASWETMRRVGLVLLFLAMTGSPGLLTRDADAQATPGASTDGVAEFTFQVGVCPPTITSFADVSQIDGLPDCTGTGIADGAAPFAGGTVVLTSQDDGNTYTVTLDANGAGSVEVPGRQTYVAVYSGDSGVFESRSVCGSARSGLAGASESGVYVATGEAMSCNVLLLSPDAGAGGSIEITLGACAWDADVAAFVVGDGHLDCNGDTTVKEEVPFPGVDLTFTNVDTGEIWNATTDADGYATSGSVTEGRYVASAFMDGVPLSLVTICGETNAAGVPLGLVGGIESADSPVSVRGGSTIQCHGLAPDPSTKPAKASDVNPPGSNGGGPKTIAVSFTVLDCPVDFDFGPVVSAGAPTAASLALVDDTFQKACTSPVAFPVDQASSLIQTADGLTVMAAPGEKLLFTTSDPALDFWVRCMPDGVANRTVSPIGVNPQTSFSLTVPQSVAGNQVRCTAYVIHGAGVLTNVIHFCQDGSVDQQAASCEEVDGDPGFMSGQISADLPFPEEKSGEQAHVYAGYRWLTRNGFNRSWTIGQDAAGRTTLTAPMPIGTIQLGLGNLTYNGPVTVSCVDAKGVVTVLQMEHKANQDAQFVPVTIELGKEDQSAQLTCNWFFEQSKIRQ